MTSLSLLARMVRMSWLKTLQSLQTRLSSAPGATPSPGGMGRQAVRASADPVGRAKTGAVKTRAKADTTKAKGDVAEQQALLHLQAQGLCLLARNQHTPGRGGGEIDLVMLAPDGTLVFVEVRARRGQEHGGAAASVGPTKQARIVLAARHYLLRWPGEPPPCRFDVVTVEGEGQRAQINWLQAAFDAPS